MVLKYILTESELQQQQEKEQGKIKENIFWSMKTYLNSWNTINKVMLLAYKCQCLRENREETF